MQPFQMLLLLDVEVTKYANTIEITTCLKTAMCQKFTEKQKTNQRNTKQDSQQTLKNLDSSQQSFEEFH